MLPTFCSYDNCLAPVIIRAEDLPTKQGAYSSDCPLCVGVESDSGW